MYFSSGYTESSVLWNSLFKTAGISGHIERVSVDYARRMLWNCPFKTMVLVGIFKDLFCETVPFKQMVLVGILKNPFCDTVPFKQMVLL